MTRASSGARDDAAPESSRRADPALSRLERVRRFFVDRYMTIDPRTAAVYRIALAALLIADTIRHWNEVRMLYTRSGVLSNDYHLYRPTSGYEFSFFHAFSTLEEVHVCFALGLLCHIAMLVGYRSRLFAFLSFVFVTSMDSRVPFVENGGYIVVNLACFWAAFLPIGTRFGLDAWRKSWRARRETSVAELSDRSDYTGERKPVVSLIGLIVIVNLTLVYFWNVENKGGAIWRWGHTVHYVLYINRMITGLAAWSRILPETFLRVVDWCVLVVEAHIAVFIASPFARRYTRPLAMLLMFGMHTTFGLMMRLGPFSWFLIACSTLLLTPIQFESIERFYLRRSGVVRVVVAAGSPLALALARIVARLDAFELLRFEERPLEGALLGIAADGDDEGRAPVIDVAAATGSIARALPFGRWVYPMMRVVTLGMPARVLGWLTRNEARATRFFGLAAEAGFASPSRCDTHPSERGPSPVPLGPAPRERLRKRLALATLAFVAFLALGHNLPEGWKLHKIVADDDSDRFLTSISWGFLATLAALIGLFWPRPIERPVLLRDRLARVFRGLREGFLAYYALASLSQTYNENKGIPPVIRFAQPQFVQATLTYPRLFQGWGMFAPNPIQEDGVLVVDGWTADGRRVDPYNGGTPDLDLTDDAGRGLSQLRQDYGNRIRLDHNQEYRTELRSYLIDVQAESGNPDDELVAFDLYWVRAKAPPPSGSKLTHNDAVPIYSYRKGDYKPRPGVAPIPPSPRLRTAEKWEDDKDTKNAAVEGANK